VVLRGCWSCLLCRSWSLLRERCRCYCRERQPGNEKSFHGNLLGCESIAFRELFNTAANARKRLVGQSGRAAYHATKHGVIGLTKSVALEYATSGIRINAICPGVVETPMFAALGAKSAEAMKQVVDDQPIGRLGRSEEIAASVLWLCSPAASFVVGAALAVDGGFTAQ
jgi:NAD(P)-dependent dehydrogenase (short-subunit alcohol dehydrogenase family)